MSELRSPPDKDDQFSERIRKHRGISRLKLMTWWYIVIVIAAVIAIVISSCQFTLSFRQAASRASAAGAGDAPLAVAVQAAAISDSLLCVAPGMEKTLIRLVIFLILVTWFVYALYTQYYGDNPHRVEIAENHVRTLSGVFIGTLNCFLGG